VHPLKSLLREHEADGAFEVLIKAGCDEALLLAPLELIRQNWHRHDRCEDRTGLNLRRLKATTKRIREVAQEMKEINRHGFALELIPPSQFTSFLALPQMLETYALLLERKPLERLGSHATLHILKFSITKHVKDSAGRFHDEEVAAVIDAVLPSNQNGRNERTYDATAHKQWRSEYYKTIYQIW
jgi:hypothetical protein